LIRRDRVKCWEVNCFRLPFGEDADSYRTTEVGSALNFIKLKFYYREHKDSAERAVIELRANKICGNVNKWALEMWL
jgi:hypothetical protein